MSGRVHRVLLPGLSEGERVLRGEGAHHLVSVVRVRVGAEVEAFDGEGLVAPGRVTAVGRGEVSLELGAPRRSGAEAPLRLNLGVALLKGDKLADVVRMGTELGVSRFTLLIMRRCDATTLSASRLARLRKIASEAARQSWRARVPEVTEPLPLSKFVLPEWTVVADPAANAPFSEVIRGAPRSGEACVITGPEGGLEPAEVSALISGGALSARFGPRVLRAQTAPVAAAAALLLNLGEP